MSDVVVVESPAKAKTIEKYLGRDFTVLASYGHVRDLEEKDGAVLPDQDFAMLWGKDPRGEQQVGKIASALKGAKRLYLATDPDREGEAISWHVKDMLAERGALKGKHVQRITFNEITKRAVQYAVAHPRDLDQPLIEAYLARRALDYLVGYTLSPVLWRKLPGSRSAGRVQSVALRLICEREAESKPSARGNIGPLKAASRLPPARPSQRGSRILKAASWSNSTFQMKRRRCARRSWPKVAATAWRLLKSAACGGTLRRPS